MEGFFFMPVPLQQTAAHGLAGVMHESRDEALQHVGVRGQVEWVLTPVLGVYGIGYQEHNPVDGYLGAHDDRQVADAHRTDVGRRPEDPRRSVIGWGSYVYVGVGQDLPLFQV